MSFFYVPVFLPGHGLVLFILGRSGKLHHRVSLKIFTRHALPSPHREPGSFSGANSKPLPTQTFSAARILALRDRGLRIISSSDAITGFFVSKRKCLSFAPSRIASLTILSSSE